MALQEVAVAAEQLSAGSGRDRLLVEGQCLAEVVLAAPRLVPVEQLLFVHASSL